jgi:hypothetical protein
VGSRVQSTPLYQYVDTISWSHGRHAFKGGVEARFGSTKSQQGSQAMPLANFGAGGVSVQGMTTVPGLAAADQTVAQNILLNLAGSIADVRQSFFLNSSSAPAFQAWHEMPKVSESPGGFPPGKIRNNHQREMSSFFKDNWKVTRALTLNLGIRWDYYAVPWEENGLFGNLRLPTRGVPLRPVGFTDRTKGIETFDNNFVSPYVQNWNLEVQRSLTRSLTAAVRYIGSKGTKLEGEVPINEVNIFENGILDAFNLTRSGGSYQTASWLSPTRRATSFW